MSKIEPDQMNQYMREQYKQGQESAKQFEREVVNIMSNTAHAQGFIEYLVNNHPTLQQKVMEIFMTYIYEIAEKPWSDARNEESVKRAKIIKETLGEYGNSFPLI